MSILGFEPTQLKGRKFWFDALGECPNARISIYEKPVQGHTYVVGADFAYGLASGDDDTACVLDKTVQERTGVARQVAEIQGKFGETFDVPLYAILTFYNGAFLLGERQVGLPTLRRLWDKYHYRRMYRQRSESRGARLSETNPELGWFRTQNDATLREARRCVLDRKCEIRSRDLLAQLSRLQWVNRTASLDAGERDADERLSVKLKGGRSPDLFIAFSYAVFALGEVYLFEDEKPVFAPGTYGDIFKMADKLPGVFGGKKKGGGWVPDTHAP